MRLPGVGRVCLRPVTTQARINKSLNGWKRRTGAGRNVMSNEWARVSELQTSVDGFSHSCAPVSSCGFSHCPAVAAQDRMM